ncbi:MAG: winged helix-turn-helix domain-containing protein [Candidatus Caldarchaeum sp.]|nr:winged helix-turn-helix domain-containing protein [Candidatus Caldarchaeum sp.]MCS7138140.1 winged helix-turn-helix domain-containing protein [Candidatus Caldarchaeum sp.]MDW7977173.1 winged helix-turn-helix domain-containing protein [Candidatus Caldarchaeum sp.]MDW8359637.1 winged helix-turn-helix domain-containing protein [Candidatus Caldarchaeum sp.]
MDKPIRRLFWWLLLGTKGGPTRLLILILLKTGARNANRIATSLRLNYKTVQHHLEVLLENGFVEAEGQRYDVKYRLAPMVRENMDVLDSIVEEALSSKQAKASVAWGRSG